jgi:hypothetical protein
MPNKTELYGVIQSNSEFLIIEIYDVEYNKLWENSFICFGEIINTGLTTHIVINKDNLCDSLTDAHKLVKLLRVKDIIE